VTAVLSVHHWSDPGQGLRELRRVARQRVVVLTWDQAMWESFWLCSYFPSFVELDRRRAIPLNVFAAILGKGDVWPVPVPHDCRDGFAGAFWRRPEAYLEPTVQSGISTFRLMPEKALAERCNVWRRTHEVAHRLAVPPFTGTQRVGSRVSFADGQS
jgi:hypothetical protein